MFTGFIYETYFGDMLVLWRVTVREMCVNISYVLNPY